MEIRRLLLTVKKFEIEGDLFDTIKLQNNIAEYPTDQRRLLEIFEDMNFDIRNLGKKCRKVFSQNVYGNQLRTQTHNKNLNGANVNWVNCQNCKEETKSTLYDEHLKSKNLNLSLNQSSFQNSPHTPSHIKTSKILKNYQ